MTVENAGGFAAGQFVLLDELSGAQWMTDPLGRGRVWAAPDWRVVWAFHDPVISSDDPLNATTPTSGGAASWFSRQDRVTSEIKEIASVSGNVVTFTSPLHISYRTSHKAQLTGFTSTPMVTNAGRRKPDGHRLLGWVHSIRSGGLLLGQERRSHHVDGRGRGHQQQLPNRAPRFVYPRRARGPSPAARATRSAWPRARPRS